MRLYIVLRHPDYPEQTYPNEFEQDKQRIKDKRWRVIELIILGVMTTVVAGGFTILGAMIERGILFN